MVGQGSGHGSGTPLSWPGPPNILPATHPSHQYCTCCPTRPALVPRANIGGRHAKHPCQGHPPISTNGPQERALSPTSTAGTGTAASLEQVRGTPESLWLLPQCILTHPFTRRNTHTHSTSLRGRGRAEGKGAHSSYDWGRGKFPSACKRPCLWLRLGTEGRSGVETEGDSRQVGNSAEPQVWEGGKYESIIHGTGGIQNQYPGREKR